MSCINTAVAAAFAALVALAAAAPSSGEDCMHMNTIRATGAGRGTYMTTVAAIRLGVAVRGPTQGAVQAQMGQYAGALVDFLGRKGAEGVRTGGARIWRGRRGAFEGSMQVHCRAPVASTTELLAGALQNGAARVNAVRLVGARDDVAAARDEAIKAAVKNARMEADAAAEPAEVEVLAPQAVDVTNMFIPRPIPVASARRGHAVQPSLRFVPQEQAATALVTVAFKTADMYEYEEKEGGDEEDVDGSEEQGGMEEGELKEEGEAKGEGEVKEEGEEKELKADEGGLGKDETEGGLEGELEEVEGEGEKEQEEIAGEKEQKELHEEGVDEIKA